MTLDARPARRTDRRALDRRNDDDGRRNANRAKRSARRSGAQASAGDLLLRRRARRPADRRRVFGARHDDEDAPERGIFRRRLSRSGRETPERTSARWQTRLTRGFRLADFTIDVIATDASVLDQRIRRRRHDPLHRGREIDAHPPARYTFAPPLFTPSLAPVAFMLGGSHDIGRKQDHVGVRSDYAYRDPAELRDSRRVPFTVVDSAALDKGGSGRRRIATLFAPGASTARRTDLRPGSTPRDASSRRRREIFPRRAPRSKSHSRIQKHK